MDSYGNGTSWADQWDNRPDPAPAVDQKKNNGASAGKYKEKVGAGFDKTKSVASTGFKKVKLAPEILGYGHFQRYGRDESGYNGALINLGYTGNPDSYWGPVVENKVNSC
ncbi:hypothetical protein Q3G72_011814 [Acer saccharum]|nr:hypothetical protein Q3G72_011814 [Acer saccharum]